MRKALIVAHGQPGDPIPQQRAVQTLAAAVARHAPQIQVMGATLAMPDALELADDDTLIYPMFMARGWFTGKELPRRLALAGAGNAPVLPPFGSDPGLPALCRKLITKAARQQAWRLSDTHLLISAHGSGRSRAPAQAAFEMARQLAPCVTSVTCGFIEEAPYIAKAAEGLPENTICLPLFATQADHVTDDLPAALLGAGFQGITLPPVGLAPQVPQMIANSIGVALLAQP